VVTQPVAKTDTIATHTIVTIILLRIYYTPNYKVYKKSRFIT
jgi:hypothetical protein